MNLTRHTTADMAAGRTCTARATGHRGRPRAGTVRPWLLAAVAAMGTGGIVLLAVGPNAKLVQPVAVLATDPAPHSGDAADDPAIWLHPTDPARSLILGTDKQGSLHVYGMDGKERQVVGRRDCPNNVDVLYGFALGDKAVDLAVASVRAGVKVWTISPDGEFADATDGVVLSVFGGDIPYGVCVYRSAKTSKAYFVVTTRSGQVEQYLLKPAGADKPGKIAAERVRQFKLGSIAEGCVADDELGHLYVAQERVGIWKFPAEPDGGDKGKLIARVGEHGLTADVEGLAIYHAAEGKGYLIASSQGSNTFAVYAREGDNAFVLTIDPKPGKIDDVNDTDGIDVTNCPTSAQFPKGFLIVQDGGNADGKGPANQNFKIYDWRDIAGRDLLIDTSCSPRGGK